MAVPEQIPVVNYVADGIVKKFDVPFEYDQQSDLHVYVDGVEPTTDKYFFADNSFSFYIAPTNGQAVKIKRITPKERDTDYNLHTNTVRPKALNTDFDRLWYVLQEVFSDVGGLSQTVQDEIIARIQGDEDLLNQLTAEISARMLGDKAVTEDLKNYVDQVIGAIINDPDFDGIDAKNVNDASGETQQQVNYNGGSKWRSRVGGYKLNERVVLTNGDIVKSTIDGNTNDPNADMTGWLNISNTGEVESIADLLAIPSPKNGSRIFVKSYHAGLGKGGGWFVYNHAKSSINDNGVNILGWIREISTKEIDPVCFGAKADFSENPNTASDDRASVQKTIDYLFSVGGGCVEFGSGNYWLNSYGTNPTSDPINILDLKSGVSFKWKEPCWTYLGNFFHDKPFHFFSNFTQNQPTLSDVHFINPRITSILSQNFMQTKYVRRVCIEFRECLNVSVKGGIIKNIDLTNAIAAGSESGESNNAVVHGVSFIDVVQKTVDYANGDHTTIYLNAQRSSVKDCNFILTGQLGWRIACAVELHNSFQDFTDSFVYGYTRMSWFVADSAPYTYVQNISDNTAYIANSAIYLWCNEGHVLAECTAKNNKIYCEHPTTVINDLYYGWQGLFGDSGQDSGGEVSRVLFESNTVRYRGATRERFKVAFSRHYGKRTRFIIKNNNFIGCAGGVRGDAELQNRIDDYNGWVIKQNTFDAGEALAAEAQTEYLNFLTYDKISSFVVRDNEFLFSASPNYVVKIDCPNSVSDTNLGRCLYLNQTRPTVSDYKYVGSFANGGRNELDSTWYNIPVNFPALSYMQEAVVPILNFPDDTPIPYGSYAKISGTSLTEYTFIGKTRCSAKENIRILVKNTSVAQGSIPENSVNMNVSISGGT